MLVYFKGDVARGETDIYSGFGEEIFSRLDKDPNKFIEEIRKENTKYEKIIDSFLEKNSLVGKELSLNDYTNLIKSSSNLLIEAVAWYNICLVVDKYFEKIRGGLFKKYNLSLSHDELISIGLSKEPPAVLLRDSYIWEYINFLKKNGMENSSYSDILKDKLAFEGLKKCYSLGYFQSACYGGVKLWTLNDEFNLVKEHIGNSKQLDRQMEERKIYVNKFNNLWKNASKNKELKFWIGNFVYFSYMRDLRKVMEQKIWYFQAECLEKISKIIDIKREDLEYLNVKEFTPEFLNRSDVKEIISSRKNAFLWVWSKDTGHLFFSGNDATEFYKKHSIESRIKSSQNKELKGFSASSGKVKGRARVIFNAHRVKDYKEGSILVTSMTTPEFVPLMKKSSAIITELGGLTCHAAIIARELRKPCIIGIDRVTQIIRDGDEIEVDANLGIVRILERIEKEESEKDEKIKLSKYMSREHSLFYAHVWSESNRDFFSQTFKDTNIKNMVFLLNDKGILEVYYELKELENVFNKISRGLTENLNLIDKITKEFYKYWNILFPYISGKKKIKNLSEMKELYSNWASWWSPMAELFVIPDIESIPKKIRDKALKVREETQEYGDDGDKVFIDFIEKNYPKYKDVANLLTPEEVFKVDKLSKKEIDLIRRRAEGCALVTFNGSSKLISVSDLEKEAEKKGVVVEGFGNFGESSYFKAFTRDFTLTAVQMWCDTQTIVKKPWAKEMQPVVPYLIFENNEQVVNNYMSGEGVKWDKEQTMKYALENKNFVKMIGEDYIKIISSLREVCKGKNTLSISELKKVLKLAREGWIYFGTMWWLLEDENLYSSKGIDVSRLKKIREEYQDADRLDSLVEESLKKLYPNITNYAKYVLESEILDEDIPSVDELKRRSKYYIYANGKLYTDKSIKDIEVLFNIKIESPVKDENFSEIRGSGKEATKNKYKKEYVRDLPLVLVEGFITGISEVYKDITNEDLKYPGMIIFSKEYIIEEWMNDKVIEELTEKIFEENSKGYEFFEKYVNYYKEHLDRYSKIKFFDNIADFKRYIKSLYKALEGFIVFYFSAGNDKTPKEILIRAREIRDKDTLGDDSDKIIRQSFSKIIPYTKNYESVISKEDLDNVPDKKILEKRIGGFVSLPGLFVGLSSLKEFSEKYPQYEFVSAMRDKSILEFKGFSAFKGKVKGRVRILIRKKDMNSLKDGEILVSPMTTPDFLPAMKRASAIVTDEGGIVCHAAIVARELKKPCVIGTKIATQVLRDGDFVEVDADNGVVRILERK